jgi:acyl carrier protein
MKQSQIDGRVRAALTTVAPECAEAPIDCDIDLQEQFDIDSVDVIHYMEILEKEFHLKIPNEAYRSFLTINGAARYIEEHAPRGLEKNQHTPALH